MTIYRMTAAGQEQSFHQGKPERLILGNALMCALSKSGYDRPARQIGERVKSRDCVVLDSRVADSATDVLHGSYHEAKAIAGFFPRTIWQFTTQSAFLQHCREGWRCEEVAR